MITPTKQRIETIFKDSKINFIVPTYQRTFDWGKSETLELLNDLNEIDSGTDSDLFLGNFIFDSSNKNEYKIVDGQQRMTTISILLIALREHAKKLNESALANELQGLIANYSKVYNRNDIKLKVSRNIYDIYSHIAKFEWDGSFIQKLGKTPITRQVKKIKPVYTAIEEYIHAFNFERLQKFSLALFNSYVIVINVENDQDVFKIFERTNARGLDLNIGDLLKNHIFSHSITKYEESWAEIVENSGGNIGRMLKYFWVSRKGYIQQSNLYRCIKEYAQELEPTNKSLSVEKFIAELLGFSKYFAAIQVDSNEQFKIWLFDNNCDEIANNQDYLARIWRVFQALKLFRITQAYPVIFSLLKLYFKINQNPKKLFTILEAIERYHFVNNIIVGRIGNEVEKFYAELASTIFNSKKEDWDKIIVDILNDLAKKKASRNEFIANFEDNTNYSLKNIILINYIYDRLNNFDLNKKQPLKGAQYIEIFTPQLGASKRNYNIEHILSQDEKKNYSAEDAETIDDIGNLLIIPRHTNSGFGNKSPKDKYELMESDKKYIGHLRYLETFLKNYKNELQSWDIVKIRNRSKKIAEDSYDIIWGF